MANDNIEIIAKLKLDTSEAESKISDMSKEQPAKAVDLKLPKDTEIKLPDKAKKSLGELFKGDGGLDNAAKLAAGASKGLGGLMGSLQGVASAADGAVKAMGPIIAIIVAIIAIISKLLQGTDTLRAIKATFEMVLDAFRRELSPWLALLGEIVITFSEMLASLAPIFGFLAERFKPFLNYITGILKVLQPFVELIGKLFQAFKEMQKLFSDIVSGIITSIVEMLVTLVDIALRPLLSLLDKFISIIEKLKVTIQDFITKITAGVIQFNKTTLASTEAIKADMKTSLDTWEISGKETASERSAKLAAEAAGSAATAANKFSGNIKSFLRTLEEETRKLFKGSDNMFSQAWTNIKLLGESAWNRVGEVASDVWEDIKTAGENVWGDISSIAEGVWSSISETAKNVWSSVAEFVSGVWESIKNTVETAWKSAAEFVSGVWKSVAESVGSMWKEVKEKTLSVWDSIKSSAESVGDSILATIRKVLGLPEKRTPAAAGAEKNVFTDVEWNEKTVVGTVIDKTANIAKTVGETVADWANTAVDAVTGFFGKLKFWKDGGTLSEGAQIWGMNEKGNPEFIFNAGGHDTVINSDILSDAVYSALVRADKGQELQLEVSIKEGMPAGPRELAQILLPSLQFLMKR